MRRGNSIWDVCVVGVTLLSAVVPPSVEGAHLLKGERSRLDAIVEVMGALET